LDTDEAAVELDEMARVIGLRGDRILEDGGVNGILKNATAKRKGETQNATIYSGVDGRIAAYLREKASNDPNSDLKAEGMLRYVRDLRHERAQLRQRRILAGLNAPEGSREREAAIDYLTGFMQDRKKNVKAGDFKQAKFVDYTGDKRYMENVKNEGLGDINPYAVVIPDDVWTGEKGSPALVSKLGPDGGTNWGGINFNPEEGG